MSIPHKHQNPKGLHLKYDITKNNGEPIDTGAEYFVLRFDWGGGDHKHVEACRRAVLKYADEIKDHLPELSKDLIERYSILTPPEAP
jgi:hypothetical protein